MSGFKDKLDSWKDKLQGLAGQHPDKVDQGLDKTSDAAKQKFGHEEQIDKFTEKGKEFFNKSDQQGQGGAEPPKPGPEQQ